MQVESLAVARRPSYDADYPNQLVGIITLKGSNGKLEVKLTNEGLSRIFGVIAAEVTETARKNSAEVKAGLSNAMSEPLLHQQAAAELPEVI